MKKIHFLFFFLFTFSLNAQFTVSKSDNTPITNGQVISFNSTNYASASLGLKITNTGSSSINMKLRCTGFINTDGTKMEVCFGASCYNGASVNQVFPSSGTVSIASGLTDSTAHFVNSDATGTGVFPMEYYFKLFRVNSLGIETGTPFTFTYRYDPNLSNSGNNQVNSNGVKIKSNLVSSNFELEINKSCELKIYDLNGKQVYFENLEIGNQVVDLSFLNESMYFVNFTTQDGNSFSQKIIKK